MMKHLSLCLAAVLLGLCLTGCSPSLEETYVWNHQDSWSVSKREPSADAVIPSVDTTAAAEELITTTVDIHDFAQQYCTSTIGTTPPMSEIASRYGVECLRQNQAGIVYSVHKVEQGGRLYLFYDKGEITADKQIHQWVYVQKELSSADFADITEGTSADKVMAIDPTTQVYLNIFNAYRHSDWWSDEKENGWQSFHYLTDGVLEISFIYKDGQSSVLSQKLLTDFQLNQYNASKLTPFDGRILDIDRVA